MSKNEPVATAEYRAATVYYNSLKAETADPRSLRCLENVWAVGNEMLNGGEKITSSALARRCLDQFGEPSVQTIYNNSSGLNPLVKRLQSAQGSLSKTKRSKNSSIEQTMRVVLDGISSPKHRSIIRDVFIENQQLKSDIRILDAFLKDLKASEFFQDRSQTSHSVPERTGSDLTRKEKEEIQTFLEITLFDEGYSLRDGEIYKGRRPLQATGFFSTIRRLAEE